MGATPNAENVLGTLYLLFNGQYTVFALLIIGLILSLSAHEYGHAQVAKWQGDNTAERLGRLTLNPVAHIDPFGLLMVVLVGFGYAKPVPVDPRNFSSRYSHLFIALAGPAMNLIFAVLAWNLLLYLLGQGMDNDGVRLFLTILAQINLLLMMFNLLPIGPLDGHYVVPYLLPESMARRYLVLNERYGAFALLGLIALAIMGVPIFAVLMSIAAEVLSVFTFVNL